MLSVAEIEDLIAPFKGQTGGVISALRELLETESYIDTAVFPALAEAFNLSVAEIRGIASFYEDFRTKPPARHTVRICQAEACQAVGARELFKEIQSILASTNADTEKDIEIQPVYCLGLCPIGPAMQVNDTLVGRGSASHLKGLL